MSTHPIIAPKKLIEVALPLDVINKACAREKSIRHGHPSTLHMWWSRKPLAVSRAILFAQLVNDPSWKYSEAELTKPQIRSAVTRRRNELFKLIAELVQWENCTNEAVLERARKEIRASWSETCEANRGHEDAATLFEPTRLPIFHDPFAGGGAIPLEAQRLGMTVQASDLNPVAVLINKAMIELPPKFNGRPPVGPRPTNEKQTSSKTLEDWPGAKGLSEDVRRYGAWMKAEARNRIGHLYPMIKITEEMANERTELKSLVGHKLMAIAWLWARTVKSPNPAYSDVEVPLFTTSVLASKPGKEAWLEVVVKGRGYSFKVRRGVPPAGQLDGTKLGRGANFRCAMSGVAITPEYIKAEGMAGRMGERLIAIVAEGSRSRVYLSPVDEQEAIAKAAKPNWQPDLEYARNSRHMTPWAYGLGNFRDLFTRRQATALATLSDLVQEVVAQCRHDAVLSSMADDDIGLDAGGLGARAYAEAVATYLGISVARYSNAASSICTWNPGVAKEDIRFTFSMQALPMTWSFAEGNPFSDSSGNFGDNIDTWLFKAISGLPANSAAIAFQANAAEPNSATKTILSTDPPYYDNVPYADLSDFFYLWLRRALRPIFPALLSTIAVPKIDELVADAFRQGSKEGAESFFLHGMTQAMHNIAGSAHPAFPVSLYYAFKQSDSSEDGATASTGWETFLSALIESGLSISGTWPTRSERGGRMRDVGSNALASSIVLVCRPRSIHATASRRDFLRELAAKLPMAIADMTADPEAAVAPVDLAQAAIGPGMAIFSNYEAVLEADGERMTVRSALSHINKTIDEYFSRAEGELDVDTRFCVAWFQQRGFEPGPFGEADVLARAKGTAVDGVRDSGVLSATKGKVRLLRVKEYPARWNPAADHRTPVWEACHHLCRALAESEHEAGTLLARIPQKQDGVRQLAYYLYTICERQKWAEEARLYNELIASWPAIVEQSHTVGHKGTQLDLL